ncbi:MAG: outer membrane beta-barrel protein [Nitrospirota bacterium]
MKFFASAVFALLTLVSAIAVNNAYALNFGRTTINPYVDFEPTYDDNVFRTSSDAVRDWYFLISPGIRLNVPQRDNLFQLEYRADIYKYVDTGDANDVSDQYLHGAAAFNFPGGMWIKAEDQANKSHEARGTANAVVNNGALSRYYSNLVNAEVGYAFADRYKVSIGYQNYIIDYSLPQDKFRDLFANAATLTLFYQLMPKTSALLQGSYKRVYHDNGNQSVHEVAQTLNSNEYWAEGGLTWNITAKSTGTIKGGYEWKLFDYPGRKDFRSPIFEVDLDHQFTAKTGIKLSGLRQAFESDDDIGGPNNIGSDYYTATMGSVELSYRPVTKIDIKPRGSYADQRYAEDITVGTQTGRRKDGLWDAGIDVTYNMNKWVAISLGYTHSKRVSNFTVYDYTDNLAMISLKGTI